jgi:hypothetical protein
VRRYASANVAGVVRGSDPALLDQLVVYTAHHDHFGIKANAQGVPEIYNGALDNAAGVAQMLAIARAFATLPERPRRSILFLAVAAEEQGLLGSESFVKHPPVPKERLIADLNIDGGNVFGRTTDVRFPTAACSIAPTSSISRAPAFPRSSYGRGSRMSVGRRSGVESRSKPGSSATTTSRATTTTRAGI